MSSGFVPLKSEEVQVLKSAAGYYIGSLYYDEELNAYLPWERLSSDYYPTLEAANIALPYFKES